MPSRNVPSRSGSESSHLFVISYDNGFLWSNGTLLALNDFKFGSSGWSDVGKYVAKYSKNAAVEFPSSAVFPNWFGKISDFKDSQKEI